MNINDESPKFVGKYPEAEQFEPTHQLKYVGVKTVEGFGKNNPSIINYGYGKIYTYPQYCQIADFDRSFLLQHTCPLFWFPVAKTIVSTR
jgi:hypothetical protein